MTDSSPLYVVLGATGQQGGYVIDALLADHARVRAVVRDPESPRAVALAGRGVDVVTGDQEDSVSLTNGLRDANALFFITTYEGSDGTEGEVRRGTTVAEAAARVDIPHVVYSSVGGAERQTGIPHFESKRRVEERLSELVSARFVRPTFFMENLRSQIAAATEGDFVLRFPSAGTTPMQMIAARDIGRAAAAMLVDPSAIDGEAVEIAGDELTFDELAVRIGRHLGRESRFEQLPLEALGSDTDRQAMMRWFDERPSYSADRRATNRLVPGILSFDEWLRQLN